MYLVKGFGLKACLCTQRQCMKAIILVHCTKGLFLCTFAFWGVQIPKSKTLFVLLRLVAVMVGQHTISISLLKSSIHQMMLWILTQTKHALFQPLTFCLSSRSLQRALSFLSLLLYHQPTYLCYITPILFPTKSTITYLHVFLLSIYCVYFIPSLDTKKQV